MKKHLDIREIIGFTSIFLSIGLFVTAFAFAAADQSTPAGGQKLFEGKCAQCHGKDAKGVVKMAKVLKVDPINVDLTRPDAVKLTDEEVTKTLTDGKKKMPSFKAKLTADQIKSVIQYLRTIQGSGASK